MQTLKTKAYGEIEINTNTAVTLSKPLFGFEEYRTFYLLEMKELEHFYWLQSGDDQELAFILVNPRLFLADYVLDVDDNDFAMLAVKDSSNTMDFVVVNIPGDATQMTMNLLGPVIINTENNIGIQTISNRSEYGTKHRMFDTDAGTVARSG